MDYDAAAVGLFRNCLRRDLGLRLTEQFSENVNSSVHTYLAVKADVSNMDESTVNRLWPEFVESFYRDVDEKTAHVMLCAVKGLPLIMMSLQATDEHHVALLVGQDDQPPQEWIWDFYDANKRKQ
jgi:hypothetical protein